MLERRFIRERGLLRDRAYQGGGLSGRGLIREGPLSERGLIRAFLVRADHEHLR